MYGSTILRTTEAAVARIATLSTQRGSFNTHKIAVEARVGGWGMYGKFAAGKERLSMSLTPTANKSYASGNKVSTVGAAKFLKNW